MSVRDKFALLRRASRVWAVASIHGEAERLTRLHGEIERRFQPGDRLVYLGNAMGHGAEVRGAIDELLSFRRRMLARPGMFLFDIAFLRGAIAEPLSVEPGKSDEELLAEELAAEAARHEQALAAQANKGR